MAGLIVGLVAGFFIAVIWMDVQAAIASPKQRKSMRQNGEDVEL